MPVGADLHVEDLLFLLVFVSFSLLLSLSHSTPHKTTHHHTAHITQHTDFLSSSFGCVLMIHVKLLIALVTSLSSSILEGTLLCTLRVRGWSGGRGEE